MRKNIVRVGQVFASGCIVYVVMAACGGGAGSGDDVVGGSSGASSSSSGGSGGPVPPALADDWHQAGSRLKLRYYESSDGAKQFATWFDSARGDECSFALHADGAFRCVPNTTTVAGYFADAGCATPVAFRGKSSAAQPKYAASSDPGTNAQRRFPVTSPFGGASIWSGRPGACSGPTPVASFSAFDLFTLGVEIPGTEFVDAAVKTAP
ncbi:MAG: hypothetical protein KF819_26825 [Labilithrix sp.]|nr:hypothetical protein [Labilithrix sp.]